jgi:hypothetical protein
VARIRHEPALASQAVLDPRQHRIEGLAEPGDLVAGRRHRQPLVQRGRGDLRRAASHRLDRPQRGAGQQVAGERCQHEGKRPADEEGGAERGQRLGPVAAGRAGDQHEPPPVPLQRHRDHARALVKPGDRRPADEDRLAPRLGELVGREQCRPSDRRGRVEDAAVGREELRERLAALDQRPVGSGERAAVPDERRQVLRAAPQLLVEVVAQIGADPLVDEPARQREHECGREGEQEGDPHAQGQPVHAPSGSLRR